MLFMLKQFFIKKCLTAKINILIAKKNSKARLGYLKAIILKLRI
jgi:hypothetical protein